MAEDAGRRRAGSARAVDAGVHDRSDCAAVSPRDRVILALEQMVTDLGKLSDAGTSTARDWRLAHPHLTRHRTPARNYRL